VAKLKNPAGIKREKIMLTWKKRSAESPFSVIRHKTIGAAHKATYKETIKKDLLNLSFFPEVKTKKANNPAVKAISPKDIIWKKIIDTRVTLLSLEPF